MIMNATLASIENGATRMWARSNPYVMIPAMAVALPNTFPRSMITEIDIPASCIRIAAHRRPGPVPIIRGDDGFSGREVERFLRFRRGFGVPPAQVHHGSDRSRGQEQRHADEGQRRRQPRRGAVGLPKRGADPGEEQVEQRHANDHQGIQPQQADDFIFPQQGERLECAFRLASHNAPNDHGGDGIGDQRHRSHPADP